MNKNRHKATSRKLIMALIKLPISTSASPTLTVKPEKSYPPLITPTTGVKISLTRLFTIEVKAPPTITPTAISTTFPLKANFLNSSTNFINISFSISTFYHFVTYCSIYGVYKAIKLL